MIPLDQLQLPHPLFTFTTSLIIILILNYLYYSYKSKRKLPPGPCGLPIVGYLPFIEKDSYISFDKLSKKYGPVYSLKLGQFDCVIICDWDHLKQASSDELLLGRPHEPIRHTNVLSFMEMSGEPWREHRRVSLHILRQIGYGKSVMEKLISQEIEHFLPTLEGDDVDFINKITPSISNIISSFLFGERYDYADETKIELDKNMDRLLKTFCFTGFQSFMPWMLDLLLFFRYPKAVKAWNYERDAEKIFASKIEEHSKNASLNEISDYVDGYLHEQDKQLNSGDDRLFNMDILIRNLVFFYAAGFESITSTLSWALMYILYNPVYQDIIRNEINEIIGYQRKPNYTDRNQMPFTVAFLNEVHRMGSVVATNLLRRASKDTNIGNYFIPKDTIVVFNFYSIHRDAKLWHDPDKFDPYRFLTDDGTKLNRPPYLIPFSLGKRNCPGESLAQVEVFLYLVSILQKYRIRSQQIDENQMKETIYGVSRRPKFLPLMTFTKL